MSFLPQHNEDDDDDSLSSISSTSPTPASATMASPPCSPTRGNNLLQPTIPTSSPPKVILEPKEVVRKQTTRRVGRHGFSISTNNRPATAVRIAIDMRTRSSRLFFVLLHLVGVSTNVPYGGGKRRRSTPSTTSYYPSPSSNNDSHYGGSNLFSFIIPSWLTWSVGIVGVHPTGILLERLDVQSSRRGLRGILERVERVWQWDGNEDLLGEPYWFQDNTDGMCLGPDGGFSECGDATLWRVKRRPLTKRQLREKRYKQRHRQRVQDLNEREGRGIRPTTDSVCVWPFFCEQYSQVSQPMHIGNDEVYGFEYENHDDEVGNEGFALQLMGLDAITANSVFSSHRMAGLTEERNRKQFFWHEQEEDDTDGECLLSFPSAKNGGDTLQIGSCSSEAAWVWHVNRDGILVRGSTKAEKRKRQRRWKITPRRASAAAAAGGSGSLQSDFQCVHRTNSTIAALLPCGIEGKSRDDKHNSLVGFSLVRYPSTLSKRVPQQQHGLDTDPSLVWEPWTTLDVHVSGSLDNNDSQTKEESTPSIPKSRTSSASAGAKQPTLKATPNMLHTGLDQGKAKKHSVTSASHIRDAPVAMNGVAFHKQRMNNKTSEKSARKPSMRPTGAKLRLEKKEDRERGGQTQIHEDLVESRIGEYASSNSNPHRPRKIPVHPYIQSSKDFVWVDPLTSLEYPTDLCEYLGHTKKEAGRHTLMGVGQYYRTAFNIKVYGAALYVAKRDVLADPKFGEYATLSSEDLRGRDDFYEHLMNMPTPGEDPSDSIGGFFDRTLLIKINMQLSTDAMRKSLEADWSLLTDEMKATIIDSSFEERMADEKMQQKIQSKENSSNCSCGQLAPPEFKADPTCCARGTELGFTWRKNGDFEVRLDGRLMDVFPRPDIAKGIFAEYLNDNPISLDAKAHFTDGFPFLLAPLAQVKGMSSAVPQSHKPLEEKVKSPSSNNPMQRMMNAAMNSMDAMNNQAHSMSKWMQDSSSSAVGSALGLARGLSEELDKQRIDLLENAVALQKDGMEMLTSLIKMSAEENGMALTIVDNQIMPTASPFSNRIETNNNNAHPEIPDEIGIKIEPTMNFTHRLFFATVHVYLLLMFLVSIPCSKTKLVVKRRILETKSALIAMSKIH